MPTNTATATPSSTPTAAASGCPSGWTCADVGGPRLVGGQTVAGDTWTVWGAGRNILRRIDQLHFISQAGGVSSGISAQVLTQSGTSPWAKAGLMIRNSTAASAPYMAVFVTPGRGIVVQYRLRPFTQAHQPVQVRAVKAPVYLRLVRNGDVVAAASSSDGLTWTTIANMTVPLRPTALLGVAITSHRPGALSVATVRGVTVTS